MNKSPSVSIIERDMSTYSVTTSATAIAIVGYATKGPVGKATLVTSLQSFREKFGFAAVIPYSYLAAMKAFNQTNQVIFTRVADTTATTSQRVINNLVSQVNGYDTLTKNTDVAPTQVGFHAGEMYGITVESRNLFISAKASNGWAIDDMVAKLNAQLLATNGFQEFTAKSLIISTSAVYCFKANLNSAACFSGANANFMLAVNNTDNLSTLATKVNAQIVSGTRSYTSSVIDASKLSALTAGTYYFKVAVGANQTVEYSIVTTTAPTYSQLASLMNVACSAKDLTSLGGEANRVGFFGVNNASVYSIVAYANTLGNIGSVVVSAGTSGTNLLAASSGMFNVSWTAVAGSSGVTNGNAAMYAEKHIDTSRLRISSLLTGASSAIAISAPDTLFNNTDASLVTLLQTAMPAIAGKAAATTFTVSRDLATRKIMFTEVNSVTPPVVASLESSPNYYSLSTLLTGTGTTGIDAPVAGVTAVTASTSDKVIIESLEMGSATNLITVNKYTVTDPLTLISTATIEVYYNNILKETFSALSLNLVDTNFIENIVNATPENGGSSWVSITTIDTDASGTITFPDGLYNVGAYDVSTEQAYDVSHTAIGTYDYRVGTDGIPQIGGEELFIAQLNSAADLGNDETNNFHILVTPDNTTEAVQNAAISLAESRGDFMYIVDPALGLSYSQAKDWHNGVGNYGRSASVNSSYAAVYWPWLKEYDADNKKYVWCPPSVFIGEKLLEVDRIYNPWYAPAGDQRGRLVAQDIETSPSFAQREVLYGDLNCVNPIVSFNGKGIEIYGQKTALRQTVASNRINVKRMLIYIKKLIKVSLNAMIFEPNNPNSWQVATNLVTSILEPIRQDNGIVQYKVVIDGSVNTPDIVAQDMMMGVIKLVPSNTIEMIEMDINVYKSGTVIT